MYDFGLMLDVLLAGLLAATVVYCFLLNRKLGGLRKGQAEMQDLADKLGETLKSSQDAIDRLRKAGDGAAQDLAGEIDKAHAAIDELGLITSSAERLAERIETGIGQSKTMPARGRPSGSEHKAEEKAEAVGESGAPRRSETESELMTALRQRRQ